MNPGFAMRHWMLAHLVLMSISATTAVAEDNLLRNGDFESGGQGPATHWAHIWPRALQDPAPEFGHPEERAQEGEACVSLQTFKPGGYSSFTQQVRGEAKADIAKLSGWVRVDEMADDSSASLLLLFLDSDGAMLTMRKTRELSAPGEWTKLELEVLVPEGAEDWMVRCGVTGQGSVAFDDVELVGERLRGDHTNVSLAAHFGTYVVRTENSVKEPWIALSIPFPFERQTPLAIRVTSEPPGRVASVEVLEDELNRPLRVNLHDLERDAEVHLRVETLVMVVDRPISEGLDVDLPKGKRIPKEVRVHLEEAPGLDVGAEEIRATAEAFDRSDLASLMRDLNAFLKGEMKYVAGNSQGAEECLKRGEAVCTGYANVAASLLIAAEVPSRILASTQMSGRLQEHYIVEAWTAELGWSRVESTMAKFPWPDTNNMILRVVYPDAKRNSGDVPIYVDLDPRVRGGFHLDPEDGCWQGADSLSSLLVSLQNFEAVEEAARKAFAALQRKPSKGPAVCLVPQDKKVKALKLDERGARLLEAVEAWLDGDSE